jgi:hypothetical protein
LKAQMTGIWWAEETTTFTKEMWDNVANVAGAIQVYNPGLDQRVAMKNDAMVKELDRMNKERVAIEERAKEELGALARHMINAGFDPAMIVPQSVVNKVLASSGTEFAKPIKAKELSKAYRLSPEELHQKRKRRAQMEQQERDYRASMLQGMGMNNTARNDALHMQMRQDEALQKQIEYQAAKALAAKKKRAMLLLTTEN